MSLVDQTSGRRRDRSALGRAGHDNSHSSPGDSTSDYRNRERNTTFAGNGRQARDRHEHSRSRSPPRHDRSSTSRHNPTKRRHDIDDREREQEQGRAERERAAAEYRKSRPDHVSDSHSKQSPSAKVFDLQETPGEAPRTGGEKSRLTCYFWATEGQMCSFPADKCKYVHAWTDKVALKPLSLSRSKTGSYSNLRSTEAQSQPRDPSSVDDHFPPSAPRAMSSTQASSVTNLENLVASLLREFGAKIVETASTQFQKDLAKANLDYRMSDFESSRAHHAEFPSIAESERSNIVKFQQECDAVEKRLASQTNDVKISTKAIAKNIALLINGRGCRTYKEAHETRDRDPSERPKDVTNNDLGIGDKSRSKDFEKQIQDLQVSNSERVKEIDQLKGQIDGLTLMLNEEVPAIKTDTLKATSKLKENFATIKGDHEALKLKVLGDVTEAQKDLIDHLQALQENEDRIRSGMTSSDKSIEHLTSRTAELEAHRRSIEGKPNAWETQKQTFITSIERLKFEVNQLRDGQQAADEYTGGLVQSLIERCDKLESSMAALQAQHNSDIQRVYVELQKMGHVLESNTRIVSDNITQLSTSVQQIERRPPSQPPQPRISNLGPEVVDMKIEEFRRKIMDEIQAIALGIRSLEYRYQNLQTDQMASHILSQIGNVYPNLRNAEAQIAGLIRTTLLQEQQYKSHELQLQAVQGQIDAIKPDMYLSDLRREMAEVRQNLTTYSDRFGSTCTELASGVEGLDVSVRGIKEDLTKTQADFVKANEDLINGIADVEARLIVLKETGTTHHSPPSPEPPATAVNGKKRKGEKAQPLSRKEQKKRRFQRRKSTVDEDDEDDEKDEDYEEVNPFLAEVESEDEWIPGV
ncbi:MAG: hypothetical protein M1818_002389 [Claussenomyces sp. TS43310]|nr:MAG: hypothetical protein M1818_002389 [Claussenomyces sp. TS43310]